MSKSFLFILLVLSPMVSIGQNITVTFTGIGDANRIDSVSATNLRTGQRVTLPGDETLLLEAGTGTTPITEFSQELMVFPNPFWGRASLMVSVMRPQMIHLTVQNMLGQVIAQIRNLVQPGGNEFSLSLSLPGIYIVGVNAESGSSGKKVICTETAERENRIQYLGNMPVISESSRQPGLKSTQSDYFLEYSFGDIILYRCSSGIYSTITTDTPTESKNYEVEFVNCTDLDGKNYPVVKIGDQRWMAENLAYLPEVSPPAISSGTLPYYYVYDNFGSSVNEAKSHLNYSTYGVLYNWEAARVACPPGWHLPVDEEWTSLTDFLGSSAGGKLKETINAYWVMPNEGATNESGFTALPGGYRSYEGGFGNAGSYAHFWSSSDNGTSNAWCRLLYTGNDLIDRSYFSQGNGLSVRCLHDSKATITTSGVTDITSTSAHSGGYITNNGGVPVIARGVCWSSTTSEPTTSHSQTMDGTASGSFQSLLTGLAGNTTYYVRAYVINNYGTSYGNTQIFTTLTGMPALTTMAVSAINQTTASSGGTVVSDGGGGITARGVCWSVSAGPTINNDKTTDGTGKGSFISNLSGLTGNTSYYVRAYATNSVGTSYGNGIIFKTNPVLPTVTTTAASDITQTSAISGGCVVSDGGLSVTERGVCWSTSQNPTIADSKTTNGNGTGEFISYLTGLTGNTTYFIRAYSTNRIGTSYGNQISLTTSPVLPTVITSAIAAITQTSAISGGNIISDGGGSITDRGVCWSTSSNPTIAGSKTMDGTGAGLYISNLSGLTGNTTYFLRAYCTNSAGTTYGNEISFKTSPLLPTVTTKAVSDINQTTAKTGGNVTGDGGAFVTARGVCYSMTTSEPTIGHFKTMDGTGTGTFTSMLKELTGGRTYYVRSYATNSAGTAYGQVISFTTGNETGTFTDTRDGHQYTWVKINTQTWMAENLAFLPAVSPSFFGSDTTAYYYAYGYEGSDVDEAQEMNDYKTYGVLYNWDAAMISCPTGWHLPTDEEWKTLERYLGMNESDLDVLGYRNSGLVGSKLKEAGTNHWSSPNTDANNLSGFYGLPGGYRDYRGGFYYVGRFTHFWLSRERDSTTAWGVGLGYDRPGVGRGYYYRSSGFSVRCIRD